VTERQGAGIRSEILQKTKQARWLLMAGAVAVAVIMIVTPNRWLVGITYPLAAGTSAR